MSLIDFSECKTTPSVKQLVRETLFSDFYNFALQKYGGDNVTRIGDSEFAIAVGETSDPDGFLREVCGSVKIVAKNYYDSEGEKRASYAFDRIEEGENYKADVEITKKKKKV